MKITEVRCGGKGHKGNASRLRPQVACAAVDVIPEIEGNIEIEIRSDELRRDTFRSGGPGGQHQNKTESGVRFTHLPTGIAAESRSQRSQHKNDEMALKMLKAKLGVTRSHVHHASKRVGDFNSNGHPR